jgi:hypothetical protein
MNGTGTKTRMATVMNGPCWSRSCGKCRGRRGKTTRLEAIVSDDEYQTPGQKAAQLIREAKAVLADPSKAEFHERLSVAVDRLQAELDFWGQLRDAMNKEEQQHDWSVDDETTSHRG